MSRQAIILAGGKGTRLKERLGNRPKPLVDVDGEPLLQRQLRQLQKSGFQDVVILVNHAADQIQKFCADAHFDNLHLTLIDDGEPRGTAGALLSAIDRLASRFLVIYGDTLFDVDLERFWAMHEARRADATLLIHPNDHPFDSDLVEIDETGRVLAFHAAPHPDECLPNLVNAALYVVEREAVQFWRDRSPPTDIARDLFPAMVRKGANLYGYISYEYIKDIGTPKRLDKAVRQLRDGTVARARRDVRQKAVFLDRDGTINQSRGHLSEASQMALLSGAADAIRRLNETDFRTVVVTNQPVLARGETTFAEMRRIHGRMETLLGHAGAYLDSLYLCPHHPDAGFPGEVATLKIRCSCRKPGTGLIEQACADLNIDLAQSWFIGDTTLDLAAARQAGVFSILVETGEAGRDGNYAVRPDFVASDLPDAVRVIQDVYPALVKHLQPLASEIRAGELILVGGLAKQGKSSVSSILRRLLINTGLSTEIISLDGFLRETQDRAPGVQGRYDLAQVKALLGPWISGQAISPLHIPVYDRYNRKIAKQRIETSLAPNSVVIVEGVPALLIDHWASERNIRRMFVGGDEGARKARVLQDLVRRGSEAKAALTIYDDRQRDEAPLIDASRALADTVIDFDIVRPS